MLELFLFSILSKEDLSSYQNELYPESRIMDTKKKPHDSGFLRIFIKKTSL